MSGSNLYKHMTINDRKLIEQLLSVPGITRKQIASALNRDPKTISEEIKNNRYTSVPSGRRNMCGWQTQCGETNLCSDCKRGKCRACTHHNCNQLCGYFTEGPVCDRVKKFPFVCSGCPDISSCKSPKFFYLADTAQGRRDINVRSHKYGIQKSPVQMKKIISAFEDGIHRKISPEVIIQDNHLPISTSTAYRYIAKREMGNVAAVDLKHKVRFKSGSSRPRTSVQQNYDYLKGRKYEDFCAKVLCLDSSVNIWEMDTVIGIHGENEKCVLSLLYRKTNLQLYFLLESNTAQEVQRVFSAVKNHLGDELFRRTFSIILTDNGSEFRNPVSLEISDQTGEKLISIYYCEPRRSDEKGKCEKNHEHFRECVPKGKSMNSLSRKDIHVVSIMVNNYPRKLLEYKSPLEVSIPLLNEKVLSLNSLKVVPTTRIKLTPIIH